MQSHLSWGSVIFGSTNPSNISKIEGIQNKAVRNLCDVKYNSHCTPLYDSLQVLKFSDLITSSRCLLAYKFRKGILPSTLNSMFKYSYEMGDRAVREDSLNFHAPPPINNGRSLFPLTSIIQAWNRIPYVIKTSLTLNLFKSGMKLHLSTKYSDFQCTKPKCYNCKQTKNLSTSPALVLV